MEGVKLIKTLRDTIRDTTEEFLLSGGFLGGQCLKAVGNVNGTIPDIDTNIIEFPTSDCSNAYIGVGFALAGKRFIQVVRYQPFMTYNLSAIATYAAISKSMWGVPCPVFVRSIGMHNSVGPVASNCAHSSAIRYPGLVVQAPITPDEWSECWYDYINGDDPVYCSEHRLTYDLTEWSDYRCRRSDNDLTILGISAGRLSAKEAANELDCNYAGIWKLKPFSLSDEAKTMIEQTSTVIVVDSDYTMCGASEHICCTLSAEYPDKKFYPLGVPDKTAGFSPLLDNKTPSSDEIVEFVKRNC